MINKNVLIVFLKYPLPGTFKTRLAKSIGEENAAMLYRCFVQTILGNTKSADYETIIFFAPEEEHKQIKKWLGKGWHFRAQKGNSLGERLIDAFRYVFDSGAKKSLVIGTDSPLIESEDILNAFSSLKEKDCVIGPAYDGGYYLLGLNCLHAELFALDEYSTDKVFENTMEKARELGLNVKVLDKRFDVDTVEDLAMLRRELEKAGFYNNSKYNQLRDKIKQI